jgi:hypothetical protein
MGRPRQYGSAAQRQRAFRQRQEQQAPRVDRRAWDGLHQRLEQLQTALRAAAVAGDEAARACPGTSVETMLEQLIRYFDRRAGEPRSGDSAPCASLPPEGGWTPGAKRPAGKTTSERWNG